MIIDLERFVASEQPFWQELDALLLRLEANPGLRLDLDEIRRFNDLYQRTAADLGKVQTFASNTGLHRNLASLMARAYCEIHGVGDRTHSFRLRTWLFTTLPRTFRRRSAAFVFALVTMLAGVLFGGLAVRFDPDAKAVLLPFDHLLGDPTERVAEEESIKTDELEGSKMTFASTLMTHNTRVSITTLTFGITWGIGTLICLLYNGMILGAVGVDYVLAGQGEFLLGWLLPHGSIELPAIVIAGQAGIVLAGALIGRGQTLRLSSRMRRITPDLVTLIIGTVLLLVWAGIVEAFFSQYHEPFIPYPLKISFGAIQCFLLFVFLGFCGRSPTPGKNHP